MISITDVAKKAGCSPTLVSRVINNQYGVSDKSRKKIKEVVAELGYTPNSLARSLVLKKTNTIGVVIDTLCDSYFFDLIKGIEMEVDKNGYDVLFCGGGNNIEKKNRYINFFMEGRVDGIVIYGSNLDDMKFIDKLVNSKLPFSLIENDLGSLDVNNILLNNQYGSKLAVDYLFKCGCKSIYHVSGDADRQAARRRLDGYVSAMKEQGVHPDESMILKSGWTEEQGYNTIKNFLEKKGIENLPDAFYFGSDQTAFGGMKALIERGISIPDEVMIVGYDDDNPRNSDFQYIPLTTIHQPLDEMGKKAIQILIKDINEKMDVKEKIMFYPNLVIRNTTKEKNI